MEPTPNNPYSNNWNQMPHQGPDLPGSQGSMILGIISLVCVFLLGCCYGIGVFPGLVTSIIGLVMGNKAMKMYKEQPGAYNEKSFKNAKAGKIMSIIALIWAILSICVLIVAIIFGLFAEYMDKMN